MANEAIYLPRAVVRAKRDLTYDLVRYRAGDWLTIERHRFDAMTMEWVA